MNVSCVRLSILLLHHSDKVATIIIVTTMNIV